MTAISKFFSGKKKNVVMTEGSIVGCIVRFALPLLVGNLFQQLYNMVDTWVIGHYGSNGAYAAVGSIGPIVNILIGFFLGLSSGAGVVISQYYGAGNKEKVSRAVHTSLALTLVLCVVFTALGVGFTPLILRLMLKSPTGEVFANAKLYLTIYFAGVSGLLIYNMGSGILRAVGDSTRPFIFLVVSALTNIVLDLFFTAKLGMGVAGVAIATVIAQLVSATLTVITLLRSDSCIKLIIGKLKIEREMLFGIIRVGIPAALQMAITAFSNVFVQSYVAGSNGTQTINLGGWTSYSKVDAFVYLPVQSLALSATTFVAQNLGIGNIKRARKGVIITYIISTVVTGVFIVPTMIFADKIAAIFNSNTEVVECAAMLLRRITPFYLLCSVNQIFSGALRGAGNARAPMIIMLSSFVVFRQIYLYIVTHFISNDLLFVAFSYPCGWLLCALTTIIYYLRFDFEKSNVVK